MQYHSDANQFLTKNQESPYRHPSNVRIKSAYNLGKSLLLAAHIKPQAKILDLGCGNGTEMLKFACHRPSCVIFTDISSECLRRAEEFANSKKIRYSYGMLETNFYQDEFSTMSVLISQPHIGIPKRVLCSHFDMVTSFSTLEYCPSISVLHFMCKQIFDALLPGGVWIGCVTNGDKLLQRCNEAGYYQDNYCQIQLTPDTNSYKFQPHGKVPITQYLMSIATLCRVAQTHGLQLIEKKSILDFIGGAAMDYNYKRLRHASQMNGKNRLYLDDIRTISLLEIFVFSKPLSESSD